MMLMSILPTGDLTRVDFGEFREFSKSMSVVLKERGQNADCVDPLTVRPMA